MYVALNTMKNKKHSDRLSVIFLSHCISVVIEVLASHRKHACGVFQFYFVNFLFSYMVQLLSTMQFLRSDIQVWFSFVCIQRMYHTVGIPRRCSILAYLQVWSGFQSPGQIKKLVGTLKKQCSLLLFFRSNLFDIYAFIWHINVYQRTILKILIDSKRPHPSCLLLCFLWAVF